MTTTSTNLQCCPTHCDAMPLLTTTSHALHALLFDDIGTLVVRSPASINAAWKCGFFALVRV